MHRSMQQIQISEFKATCLAVLDRVHQTGEPVLITRRGQPIARVVPATQRLGTMIGTGKILGDIVSPLYDEIGSDARR